MLGKVSQQLPGLIYRCIINEEQMERRSLQEVDLNFPQSDSMTNDQVFRSACKELVLHKFLTQLQ